MFEFFEDFEDFSGWKEINGGEISQDSYFPYTGSYSLLKDINCPPSGGEKYIGKFGPGYILEFNILRRVTSVCPYDEVGISNGTVGYLFRFEHGDRPNLSIVLFDGEGETVISRTSASELFKEWYRGYISLNESNLEVRLYKFSYIGRGIYDYILLNRTSMKNPLGWFDRVLVLGGYPYFVDAIRIRKLSEPEPTVKFSCYYGGVLYNQGECWYEISVPSDLLGEKQVIAHCCFGGKWVEMDPSEINWTCSEMEGYMETFSSGNTLHLIPSVILNVSSSEDFTVKVGGLLEYKGRKNYTVFSVFGGNAYVDNRLPVEISANVSYFRVFWSPMIIVNGSCCGDDSLEYPTSRICLDPWGKGLSCVTDLWDLGCYVIDTETSGNFSDCSEACDWLGDEDCYQECLEWYNRSAEELMFCVYNGKLYRTGSLLIVGRNENYGIENKEIGMPKFYYRLSNIPGIGRYPEVTGIPIYRGNVSFLYKDDKLYVNYSEIRKIPLKCVNGIWIGTCGNDVCDPWEDSEICPEDCCTSDCIDLSTGSKSLSCVGFNGCSDVKECVEGYERVCLGEIVGVNESYCSRGICSWEGKEGFLVSFGRYLKDCGLDLITDCESEIQYLSVLEQFLGSPYAYLIDLDTIKGALNVSFRCVQSGTSASCSLENYTLEGDLNPGLCNALKGVWLENSDYCNGGSCCCGDDVGEVPVQERYIDYFGRLFTGRRYCMTNPKFCILTNKTRIVYCPEGSKIRINVTGSCDLDSLFKSALEMLVYSSVDKEIFNEKKEEFERYLSDCLSAGDVNYTVEAVGEPFKCFEGILDLNDTIIMEEGYEIVSEPLIKAVLFPGNYTCKGGYWILDDLNLTTIRYPVKLSYVVSNVYNVTATSEGSEIERIEKELTYNPEEVERWK